MQKFNEILKVLDTYIGSHLWFVILLVGTGLFYTIYLGFPQVRFFKHAVRVVSGKFDRKGTKGDTSHFQALTTALSGTIGTGNIAGVALAIHLGGPSALFWMLVTAFFGMTTKFVEVLLSHKYREFDKKGNVAGGPMYYMKKRLNIKLKNGKELKTGLILGGIFAVATVFSSFGTGSLPQINSISTSLNTSFGIPLWITGLVLGILLALVIIGGIKRIAKVTEKLVPTMAVLYLLGAIAVLVVNYQNILPSIASIFTGVFTGTAATGGFLGATLSFAMRKGVGRGLFSNEAGQGSAPIAHASARASEPVSEGMVAILEPFIDTIVICMITGITLLSSGAWNQKYENTFQEADILVLNGVYEDSGSDREKVGAFITGKLDDDNFLYNGDLTITDGKISNEVTIIHARSFAENIEIIDQTGKKPYSGVLAVVNGEVDIPDVVQIRGESLIHSASLTTLAFNKGLFGNKGQYIVSLGILLFAFSTAISWSYYGDRAITFLLGTKYVFAYRIVYVLGFFLASFTDTTIVWNISAITIALMTIPNLISILFRCREVKSTIAEYWSKYRERGQA
ncbi:MAG: sodium:alanine symporter family protein [Bacteroidales bacterium]|nr:sodium:alanine symporter family protein [Bacteroidales bacterium]